MPIAWVSTNLTVLVGLVLRDDAGRLSLVSVGHPPHTKNSATTALLSLKLLSLASTINSYTNSTAARFYGVVACTVKCRSRGGVYPIVGRFGYVMSSAETLVEVTQLGETHPLP